MTSLRRASRGFRSSLSPERAIPPGGSAQRPSRTLAIRGPLTCCWREADAAAKAEGSVRDHGLEGDASSSDPSVAVRAEKRRAGEWPDNEEELSLWAAVLRRRRPAGAQGGRGGSGGHREIERNLKSQFMDGE